MTYIITGTSSGIGQALANFYLEKGEKVIGISRRNELSHPNFTHIPLDLGDLDTLENFSFKTYVSEADFPLTLINNAGTIGTIRRSYELDLAHYQSLANLNLVAPQFLSSLLLREFGFENVATIVMISSGAAQRPIPSWSAYCASKAGIDLFAETLSEEIKELGQNTRVLSVAPGVVDTEMQVVIRASGEENFSQNQKFVDLKENNELRSPTWVAKTLAELLENKELGPVVQRL